MRELLTFVLLGTHLYFTIHLHGIQKKIPKGIRLSLKAEDSKVGTSAFSALATALAATMGTGNIIGMSSAIAIGGPGAVFWCWITGVFGIATCYAECYLSMRYRKKNKEYEYIGGPMYVMEGRMKQKYLPVLFCLSAILVSFGMGSSVQAHAISMAVVKYIRINPAMIGGITTVLAAAVILGGARQIAKVCMWMVPFMSFFYLSGCAVLLWLNRKWLGMTIQVIMQSAFGMSAMGGGMVGGLVSVSVGQSMKIGITRGLFTNEAGLGSIPMAAASSKENSLKRQSLVSMTGPFWDTVVMCAITGIVIVSCVVKNPVQASELLTSKYADQLCFFAFSNIPIVGSELLSISLILFAFATLIGWNYYGLCAVKYLWNGKGIYIYQGMYLFSIYMGSVLSLELIWNLSDLFNFFMMVPNVICLWYLRKEVSP